jgi:hypothetical protein
MSGWRGCVIAKRGCTCVYICKHLYVSYACIRVSTRVQRHMHMFTQVAASCAKCERRRWHRPSTGTRITYCFRKRRNTQSCQKFAPCRRWARQRDRFTNCPAQLLRKRALILRACNGVAPSSATRPSCVNSDKNSPSTAFSRNRSAKCPRDSIATVPRF